jgi:hypothetical protein
MQLSVSQAFPITQDFTHGVVFQNKQHPIPFMCWGQATEKELRARISMHKQLEGAVSPLSSHPTQPQTRVAKWPVARRFALLHPLLLSQGTVLMTPQNSV